MTNSNVIVGKTMHGHVDRAGLLFWVGKVFVYGEFVGSKTFWTRRGAENWVRQWVV